MSSKRGCTIPTKSHKAKFLGSLPSPSLLWKHKGSSQHCIPLNKWPIALGEAPSSVAVSSSDWELGEGVEVGEWAASNRNDRNCCLLTYFYLYVISPQFSPPVYTMLFPLHVISPFPHHLCGQLLAHFTLPFCCHSCLLGRSMGAWYVWSPESSESGLQWHVNPGRVSDPRGG